MRRRRKENYGNVEEEGKTKNEGEEKGNQKMRRRRRESNKNVEEEKEERK